MKERFAIITFVPACLFMMAAMINGSPAKNDNDITVRYGRDIRPLLSDRCFLCHGPDRETQKAGLRLDSFGEATLVRDGQAAIVPGDPEQSLLWKRITTDNPRKKMPPEDSGKHRLAPEELERIRIWIESGAEYEPHWAFAEIENPAPPAIDNAHWCKNPIDVFILDELRSAGMTPNDEADRRTLARRVFLDLTGLPPTPEEIALFLSDAEPNAYERLVDRLLTEEPYVTRYAERMATPWLDLSRYADTSGIHMDNGRTIWPWRDWVLDAYRTNMPYDQFVVEQLAGDLIENASTAQMVASGFNRNHTITDEGGAIDEEYLLEYAVDRTNTVGTVFLGLTVGCGRCHDHKFDPISTEEFYSLLAFFNNNEEPGIYSQTADPYRAYEPAYSLISDTERKRIEGFVTLIDELKAEQAIRTPAEQKLLEEFRTTLFAEGEWTWETPPVLSARSESASTFTIGDDSSVLVGGEAPANDEYVITLATESTDLRAIALEVIADPALPAGRVGRANNGNAIMSGFTAEVVSVTDPRQRRALNLTWAWADIEQANGDYKVANVLRPDDGRVWAVDAHTTPGNRIAMFTTAEPFGFEGGSTVELRLGFTSPYPKHSFGKIRTRLGHTQESALARLPIASTNWYIAGPYPTASGEEAYDTAFGPEESGPLAFEKNYGGYSWRYASGVREAEIVTLAQVIGAEYVGRELYVPSSREVQLSLGSDDGLQVYLNGELVHENRISRGAAPDQDVVSMTLQPGRNTLVCKVINTGGPAAIYHRQVPQETELPHGTVSFLLPEDALPERVLTQARLDWRSRYSPDYQRISGEIKAVEQAKESAESGIPQTMVMQERSEVRPTYVLARGMYDQPIMDRPVERGVPQVLGTLGKSDQSASRIDLAEWLIGDENTLTARVTVNRFWELLFGTGLVETSDDFGLQGSWPSHPELLDWLAVEFKNNGWDVQAILKLIVTSATYRQQSGVTPEYARKDPRNTLLSRFPRQRLTAEQLRDQALHISDLLVEKLGGPSVKPYQPDGLWREVAMPNSNTRTFEASMGEDLWRRSLYTYWKRAAPPPSMMTLDAPTREYCATRRLTTNTPLQALVLWNDVQFVESARMTATKVLNRRESEQDSVVMLYELCTGDEPSPTALNVMLEALKTYRTRYIASHEDARSLLAMGESPLPTDIPVSELAAWTMLANAVLSSEAAIVKD